MTEISKEYATALFELALEQKKQAEFAQALEQVQQHFRQNPEYEALLMAPGIPASQRTGMLAAAFGKLTPEYVLSFLQLLCEKGRMELLDDCITEFNRLFQASQQISVARAVSAVPLRQRQREQLVQMLRQRTGHEVQAEFLVDKSLLGGMVVYLDGSVLDGSLRSRLRDVKEVISS